ncbi:hypothetical protein IWW36_001801 [Coemansia brasiliensis]|uniref:Uncharacterized protein n=1 Tax=Coemansia brasiliensis TaxID=2650707 RepID=A0A9W8LYR5_9FUNG|nr:hypothetical protein IWW36_001801 [Coemansia brasiliensis]
MFEPVHQVNRNSSHELLETPVLEQPEDRSLGLLLVDPATQEYVEPELHGCRVRCVFDSMESRGIVYRAKRMQAKLNYYLRINRDRYIRVYRARLHALIGTGTFNSVDVQVARGHLTMLEHASGEDQGRLFAESTDMLAMDRASNIKDSHQLQQLNGGILTSADSVLDNGTLRRRTTIADIEQSLVCLSARFALPEDFAKSREFSNLCAALYTAQNDGILSRPFGLGTSRTYDAIVDRQLMTLRSNICAKHLATATQYSLTLNCCWKSSRSNLMVISAGIVVDKAVHTFDWIVIENGSAETAAQQVADSIRHMEQLLQTGNDQHAKQHAQQMPPLLAIVTSSRNESCSQFMERLRLLVARSLDCCYHMKCAAQTLDSISQCLLEPPDAYEEPYNKVGACSASLFEVARAIASDPEAHQRWVERKGNSIAFVCELTEKNACNLLPLFQQMVSVDYDLLLELKNLVIGTMNNQEAAAEISAHFDNLLDRSKAPMFLALVQILVLLDSCVRRVRSQTVTLPDLAVIFARLESTLEAMARNAANEHSNKSSDDMQLVAHCVLARLRQFLATDSDNFTGNLNESTMLSMILAHSLSLYPQDNVHTSYEHPLTSMRLMEFALSLWSRIQNPLDSEAVSMPELFLHWSEFRDHMDTARSLHGSSLPSKFSFGRVLDLVGASLAMQPMPLLASCLCDGPGLVMSETLDEFMLTHLSTSDSFVVQRLSDPVHCKELLLAYMVYEQRQLNVGSKPSKLLSISQHHHDVQTFTVDVNDPPNSAEPTGHDNLAHSVSTGYEGTLAIITSWQEDGADNVHEFNDSNMELFANTLASDNVSYAIPSQLPASSLLLCYFDHLLLPSLLQSDQ